MTIDDVLNMVADFSNPYTKNKEISSIKEAKLALLKIILGEKPKKDIEVEHYWMWQSIHNVFDYGKMMGRNEGANEYEAKIKELFK